MDTPKQIIANDNRYMTTTYSVFPGIEFSFIALLQIFFTKWSEKSGSD